MKIMPNAARLGATNLGHFLTARSSILIVAFYLPLHQSAGYSLALNIIGVIISVTYLYMTIATPQLNRLRQQAVPAAPRALFALQNKIYLVCLGSYIFGVFAFILLGDGLLKLMGSNTLLPALGVLVFAAFNAFIECARSISMNFLATANEIPFLWPTLITGSVILCTMLFLFESGYQSLYIPFIVVLLCQTLYNNWAWFFREYRQRYSVV
jgi:O-antigen/teichoic acid export membrane protein